MDLFRLTSSCRRRALQRVYGPRRTFLTHEAAYKWKSPVSNSTKLRQHPSLPPGVNTLDPCRFTDAQYFDIHQSSLRFHFRRISSQQFPDPHGRQFGNQIATGYTEFPPGTCGYLYLHSPADHNPLVGAVRFRVAATPSKEGFLAGHDMLMDHGLPWQIPLWEIFQQSSYRKISAILMRDGLAPPLLQQACLAMNVCRDSVFIPALGVPWAVNWSVEYSRVYFVRQNHHPVAALVGHPWFSQTSERKAPYIGRGLVSVVKDSNGALGLRIDKVLRLVQYGINRKTVVPAEGLVTPFNARPIFKTTKMSMEKMVNAAHQVYSPILHLPWYPAKPDLFDLYRHPRRHMLN
ncbi:hypothetical protein K438DRAFT_854524 [Mycena galopus ATCC 62051]|nr:hypothetical protein K438DRAFT_854524 [Mycena galopus ATCC 62051]